MTTNEERTQLRQIARFKKKYKKALDVAQSFCIKILLSTQIEKTSFIKEKKYNDYDVAGRWNLGKTIEINVNKANNYTILHEVGHVINGYMCCIEHCEYAAHGAAIALSRVYKIKLGPYARTDIDVYAGMSSRKACGAIEKRKLVINDGKTRYRKK